MMLASSCTLRLLRHGGGDCDKGRLWLGAGLMERPRALRMPGYAGGAYGERVSSQIIRRSKSKGFVVASAEKTGPFDRAMAAAGYILPLLDGMQYGRYIFGQYPASQALLQPLFPLLRAYSSIPFSNFIAFFTLYLAVVRNPQFGRFVRFNAMQACVMDVLIVIPLIVQRILNPRTGIALDLLIIFYNTIFICLLLAFVFGFVSCLVGRTPRLPIVADAADNQMF